jgi:hypothetical protein
MNTRCASLVIPVLLAAVHSFAGVTYYVDSQLGEDSRTGTSSETSWKSLERLNQAVFQPGDAILFKTGARFAGQFQPQGSGSADQSIRVGKYGDGALPRMDGEGRFLDTLLLHNVSYWEVRDIEVTNLGTNREPWRTGVHLLADNSAVLKGIKLSGLFVHDVNGDLRKTQEGCGIYFESRGNGARFDGLLIENCHVVRADRNGICQRSRGAPRSTGVVIRGNLLEDIGGDAIKLWGSNGGLVERNVVRGGSQRCTDAAAGIWPFASDDSVIQFNEVSGMKGTIDSQGFDSDYQCRNSLFQYNYSHDNEGGFILICSPGNSYCEGTVIRYNISQNDGTPRTGVFHFGGGASVTRVYNNFIYVGPNQDLPLLKFTEWSGGRTRDTLFENNIFYVEGRVTYRWGESTNTTFTGNNFFGNHQQPPSDSQLVTNKPTLTNPGSGKDGLESLAGYQLKPGIEVPRGIIVTNNGGRDFFGNAVPANAPPAIGVHEPSGH